MKDTRGARCNETVENDKHKCSLCTQKQSKYVYDFTIYDSIQFDLIRDKSYELQITFRAPSIYEIRQTPLP